MSTPETISSGAPGGDEPPKQNPGTPKDTETVKKEVLAAAKETLKEKVQTPSRRGGNPRVRPGGFLGASLRQAGVGLQKPTEESKQKRVEEAQRAEEVRQEAKKSIEDEFWGAYEELGTFGYSPVSSGKHLTGGEDPDTATIDFFAAKPPHEWLAEQGRGSFVLVRSKSETHGDGIGFTVYFREDLKPPRRSVAGYLQQGRLTIVHVGPIQ